MTREEAIKGLKALRNDFSGYKPNEEMFDMAIEALEAQKWIPASKRLPEKKGRYWVWAERLAYPEYMGNPDTYQGSTEASFIDGRWYGINVEKVIAWMPLPKPYTEGEE